MAKQTITTTEYTDDLDGGKAEGTVTFAFDGTNYEIDLSKKNAREFDKVMSLYVGHARKVRSTRTPRRVSTGPDLAAVRAWAKTNGYTVSDRGRVSGEVLAAYEAAGN